MTESAGRTCQKDIALHARELGVVGMELPQHLLNRSCACTREPRATAGQSQTTPVAVTTAPRGPNTVANSVASGSRKSKRASPCEANPLISLVGVAGFVLATPCTTCKCATRLRYTPTEPKSICQKRWDCPDIPTTLAQRPRSEVQVEQAANRQQLLAKRQARGIRQHDGRGGLGRRHRQGSAGVLRRSGHV